MINNIYNQYQNRDHNSRLSNIDKPTNYSFIRDNMGNFDFLKKDTIPKGLNNVDSLSEIAETKCMTDGRNYASALMKDGDIIP